MPMLADNVFLKIIDKSIPAKVAHEDDLCLAFHDIGPKAPVHVLIIPKKTIRTHADVADADATALGHIHVVAAKLAKQLGLTDGYRLVINCDEKGGQTVPHLHFHLMDSPSMLGSSGLPYVIDSFAVVGKISAEKFNAAPTLAGGWSEGLLAVPTPRHDEFPMDFTIVNFRSN